MKKIIVFLALILIIGCKTQKNGQPVLDSDSSDANKPQTKIIVNKEFDENGNLISFDSSYSYFYSNINQDSLLNDSALTIFQDDFFNSFSLRQRPFLNDLFFEDSLLSYDFYKDDFFTKRFQLNRQRFDRLFSEMDSVKNSFYHKLKNDVRKEGKTKDP